MKQDMEIILGCTADFILKSAVKLLTVRQWLGTVLFFANMASHGRRSITCSSLELIILHFPVDDVCLEPVFPVLFLCLLRVTCIRGWVPKLTVLLFSS